MRVRIEIDLEVDEDDLDPRALAKFIPNMSALLDGPLAAAWFKGLRIVAGDPDSRPVGDGSGSVTDSSGDG